MAVPGYTQDAQKDYIELLARKDVDDIFIMAPFFSAHKVVKALVKAADRLLARYTLHKKHPRFGLEQLRK
jgi:hypothetical protein